MEYLIREEALEWLLGRQDCLNVLNGFYQRWGPQSQSQSPHTISLLVCMMECIQRTLKVVDDLPEHTVVDPSLLAPMMLLEEELDFIASQSKK